MTSSPTKRVSTARILGYALGEGATSITINGISNFAMLYYTQILGMGAAAAGIALSISLIVDAVVDPVMGHVTDNTRTRYGARLPYILWGGIGLAGTFFLVWLLPGWFHSSTALFVCVLATNLAVRFAMTVFGIPYNALGFEICPGYEDRSRLQGIRMAFNQAVNLLFGALAWSMFFRDQTAPDGSRIDGTLVTGNYLNMGIVLSGFALVLILLCVVSTRFAARDNRGELLAGNTIQAFWRDLTGILCDRVAWYVFGFFAVAQLAMLLVSQIQMFTYVFFMKLPADAKTMVHGGGMVAFAIGALIQAWLTQRMDKKTTGYIGMLASIVGGVALFVLFIGGILKPESSLVLAGVTLPLGFIAFALGQALWWGGCGILTPLAMSMVADLSEINFLKTGILKDGSYGAVFTFILKACMSVGLLMTGWIVEWAGIVSGAATQTPAAAYNTAVMTFLSGPALVVISFLILRKYPVDRLYLKNLEQELSKSRANAG